MQATGTLVYDEFGNLTIDARTTDPAAPVAARESNLLSFKGRAVIDAAKSELKLMDLTGNVNPDEVLSPERRRRYEVNGDTLNEGNETFGLTLWNVVGSMVARGSAVGTILDDDPMPTVSVADTSVTEGTTACVTGYSRSTIHHPRFRLYLPTWLPPSSVPPCARWTATRPASSPPRASASSS